MSAEDHVSRKKQAGRSVVAQFIERLYAVTERAMDRPTTSVPRPGLLLLIVFALAPLPRASAMEPDYRAFIVHCVKLMAEGEYTRMPRLIECGKSDSISAMGAAEARLWQWTSDAGYATRARSRIEAVLARWEEGAAQGKRVHDMDRFFLKYPFLAAYKILLDTGQVDEELTIRVVRFVNRTYRRQVRGNHNQIASRVAGQALALKLFPDSPMAAKWQEFAGTLRNWWQGSPAEGAVADDVNLRLGEPTPVKRWLVRLYLHKLRRLEMNTDDGLAKLALLDRPTDDPEKETP